MSNIVKLGDYTDYIKGFAFKSKDFVSSGVPVIKVGNLNSGLKEEDTWFYLPEEFMVSNSKVLVKENDAIISTVGSWETNPNSKVGKCCIIDKDNVNKLLNQNAVIVRTNDSNKLRQEYLGYVLKSDKFQNYIIGCAQGSANQASITLEDIKKYEFELPNVEQQMKLINKIDVINEKVLLNKRIVKKCNQIIDVLYRNLFLNENKKCSFDKYIEIKNEVFNPSKHKNMIVEHYSIPAFDENKFPNYEDTETIKSNKYIVPKNSFLMSKLNPKFKRLWIPYNITENSICSTEFIVYLPKDDEIRGYVYSILNSNDFYNYMCSHTSGSTNSRQRTEPKLTLKYEINKLSHDNIINFCKKTNYIVDMIRSANHELVSLDELYKYILNSNV